MVLLWAGTPVGCCCFSGCGWYINELCKCCGGCMSFGTVLKGARQACGFTQRHVAISLGVSQTAVYMWETGRATPTLGNLVGLERLFGLDRGILLVSCGYESPDL